MREDPKYNQFTTPLRKNHFSVLLKISSISFERIKSHPAQRKFDFLPIYCHTPGFVCGNVRTQTSACFENKEINKAQCYALLQAYNGSSPLSPPKDLSFL